MAKLPSDVVAYLGNAPSITQTHESALQDANAAQAHAGTPAHAACVPSALSQALAPVGAGSASGHGGVVPNVAQLAREKQGLIVEIASSSDLNTSEVYLNHIQTAMCNARRSGGQS